MANDEMRLRHFAREVARLRESPAASKPFVVSIKQFQRDRLARTHADLLQSDRYRLAARFFLDELYGVKDFSARDAELARMIPSMARLLPSPALGAIADAVELDAISEQLDDTMAALLQSATVPAPPAGATAVSTSAAPATLTEERYFDLYRATGKADLRARQIALIEDIGRELDRLLGKPFLYRILKGMERPARLAGLGQMQAFLVSGFEAFRAMNGADHFIRTVVSRERELMNQAFAAGADAPGEGRAGDGTPAGRNPEI